MVRSLMAVLALSIFPGFTAGQEPLPAPERATLEEMVHFDFDEATITAETDRLLRSKLPILRNSTNILLRLEGHADERGSIEYNLALGSRRAESVRTFLTGLGISEDRITTTSFGKERPLVNRSDEEAWAMNRRVEFVISGAPAAVVAGADDAVPDPEPVQPEPAIVGDVAVAPPPDPEVEPAVVARPTRTNSERNRRSRFYRDPTANTTVRAAEVVDYRWVSRTSTRAAEWLGPMTIEQVPYDGTIASLIQESDVRTAFPYTRVRLTLRPGFRPGLGDELQIFRPARVNVERGVVLRPMGVMTVTRVAPNTVEGTVGEVFGLVKTGDLVRPAPNNDLVDGQYPEAVSTRSSTTIIEFGEQHQLYSLRQIAILDQGADDGLDIGDEYVAFSGDGSTEDVIGRLRVVLTEEETASAEIVTVEGVVFNVGTTVYLDRKMR